MGAGTADACGAGVAGCCWGRAGVAEAAGLAATDEADRLDPTPTLRLRKPPPLLLLLLALRREERCSGREKKEKHSKNESNGVRNWA